MRLHIGTVVVLVLLAVGAGSVGWIAMARASDPGPSAAGREARAVAVEVGRVRSGTIRDVRVFSGTLEAAQRITIAARAPGVIRELTAGLGDRVARGGVVGVIDDQQFVQSVAQAGAELEVRRAELARAEARLAIAKRQFDRESQLRDDGVSAQAVFDEAQAALQTASAERAVAAARVDQSEAAVALANIRLDETRVRADWEGRGDAAYVGERFVDAGTTVQTGDPVVSLVTLDPMRAVFFVTERDYGRLSVDRPVTLTTDAVPGKAFTGRIARIAPVFRETSRQARVEVEVANPDEALRPGMFVRAAAVLKEKEAGALVPIEAITRRRDAEVLFVVDRAAGTVREAPVVRGIAEEGVVEVEAAGLRAGDEVVTLGHQLLGDGSPVRVVEQDGGVP